MQYNNRSRLPPPPPFGRGGGAAGYPRGHKQLYYAPPPPPSPFPPAPAPPPSERKYEVLMEAGRLAAEYLVTQGVLPPAALQRGAGSSGAWAAHPLPPPPLQQLQEPHGFHGRRRYEDEYSNNPGARPRRANGTSSSTSSRDDYSSGSYNGRGKRKYGEYKRGYDSGRDREKERGRSSSNGRRNEEDEDEAPGFWRERRGSRWSDEVRSSVTEAVREEAPLTAKALAGLDMEDNRSKIESSVDDVRKDTDAAPKVLEETEEGEMEDDSEALNSEPEVVEQEMDTDVNNASAGVVMNPEPNQLPDGKIQYEVPDEEAEDDDKISDEAALDHNTSDGEVTNVENDMHDGKKNLIDYCNFARAPTRARSVRPHRNVASVPGETAVVETVDPISSRQTSQMVIGESANESSLTNIESENREDQIYQENNNSGAVCAEPIESMRLQENGTSFVIENMAVDKVDAQPHAVQEYKEETSPSPSTDAHNESLMQETTLSPFTASQKDSLMQETDLSPLTADHKDSLIEETTLHNGDSLTQETDLSQTISSHENNLKLQFKEGTTICDIDVLPQDVDLIKLSDQKKIVGHDAGAKAVIKMEEGKVNQSSSLNLSDLELIGSTEFSAIHDSPVLVQHSEVGSSVEPHNKQQETPETFIGANTSSTDDLCQLPLENKDIQVIDIECGKPVEVGGFDSSESKNDMVCSSMDSMMDPGIHTDVLPGIQDGYSLEFSDFLGADISCYPSMQSDLHAGLGVNDSEGITVMDDPIYGSLTDIGFMDVWGQPTQDYDKFF
ncbi:unnamed protein product [Urochloa decumbens]|uniref:Uncharacterized protein n=1 Tax=Urochloa decumbens TaxID=240449 RepID=A0ABC8VBF8_9POAL